MGCNIQHLCNCLMLHLFGDENTIDVLTELEHKETVTEHIKQDRRQEFILQYKRHTFMCVTESHRIFLKICSLYYTHTVYADKLWKDCESEFFMRMSRIRHSAVFVPQQIQLLSECDECDVLDLCCCLSDNRWSYEQIVQGLDILNNEQRFTITGEFSRQRNILSFYPYIKIIRHLREPLPRGRGLGSSYLRKSINCGRFKSIIRVYRTYFDSIPDISSEQMSLIDMEEFYTGKMRTQYFKEREMLRDIDLMQKDNRVLFEMHHDTTSYWLDSIIMLEHLDVEIKTREAYLYDENWCLRMCVCSLECANCSDVVRREPCDEFERFDQEKNYYRWCSERVRWTLQNVRESLSQRWHRLVAQKMFC